MTAIGTILAEKQRQAEEARMRQAAENEPQMPARLRAAAGQKPAPVKVHYTGTKRRLTQADQIERAELIRAMVKDGKRNIDIVRECKEVYGNTVAHAVIAAVRNEESASEHTPAEPTGNVHDIQELGTSFKKCFILMRKHGVVRAKLDAEKDEAQIEIKATRTMSL